MPLKLMYITNQPEVAKIAEKAGVDRIIVDLEWIGKALRQGGMDTVQNHHTIEDIKAVRKVVKKSDLLVRVNPIHDGTEQEIEDVIEAGADIIMLPFFKTGEEVMRFIKAVNGRARTMLLFENTKCIERIDSILSIPGIDEAYIGLNDLSISSNRCFMFQPLADGTVASVGAKFIAKGIPYGFGGIASLGRGMLPAEYIIMEHYRLGSSIAILSRSFCNVNSNAKMVVIRKTFAVGVRMIRLYERRCRRHPEYYDDNARELKAIVDRIVMEKQQ